MLREWIWGAVIIAAIVAAGLLTLHPDTPLPREWNVTKRLHVSDPVTPLTPYKLQSAADDAELCPQVLEAAGLAFEKRPELVETPQCGIRSRVVVSGVGAASLVPVETSCAVALRLAMWERHGIQPAAKRHLGASVIKIEHFSSYNCRQIRTTLGNGNRMSMHATAEAIDISGFRLNDGTQLTLKHDYFGQNDRSTFLTEIRDSACQWFETTLGPEYNSLHHDHFHLQSRGWGTCR
jgi:hypothetical protein